LTLGLFIDVTHDAGDDGGYYNPGHNADSGSVHEILGRFGMPALRTLGRFRDSS
jgi:hypothetical protein